MESCQRQVANHFTEFAFQRKQFPARKFRRADPKTIRGNRSCAWWWADTGEITPPRILVRVGERFQAKACPALDAGWRPVRVKKTRQIKNLEPRFDSIRNGKRL
jgi:hypothetical protein